MDSRFKVGDRVVADGLGFGTVQVVAGMSPLWVSFDSGLELPFQKDGKFTVNDPRPTIHSCNTGDVTFSTADIPDLPVDTLIWVRDYSDGKWLPRYLKEFNSKGEAVCWSSGATSKTTESYNAWPYCRLTDPSEDKS